MPNLHQDILRATKDSESEAYLCARDKLVGPTSGDANIATIGLLAVVVRRPYRVIHTVHSTLYSGLHADSVRLYAS